MAKLDRPGFDLSTQNPFDQGKTFRSTLMDNELEFVLSTQNDPNRIQGLIQGRMQCFSTCFAAWATLQGLVKDRAGALQIISNLDTKLGNNGGGVFVDTDKCVDVLSISPTEKEVLRKGIKLPGVSSLWFPDQETFRTKREAGLLKSGGVLVLQSGNHYRMVFIDNRALIQLYDPLFGICTPIEAKNIFDYAIPTGQSQAMIAELPVMNDDFMVNRAW